MHLAVNRSLSYSLACLEYSKEPSKARLSGLFLSFRNTKCRTVFQITNQEFNTKLDSNINIESSIIIKQRF